MSDAPAATAAAAAAPVREERPSLDDTLWLANLPADVTRDAITEWSKNTFNSEPSSIRIKKPRAIRGEQPKHRFVYLQFADKEAAAAALATLQSTDSPVQFGEEVVQAEYAKAPKPRAKKAPKQDANTDSTDGSAAKSEGGGRKKRKPRKKKGKKAAAGSGDEAGEASAADGRRNKKRAPKGKKQTQASGAAADEAKNVTSRIYCKNFGSEEELRAALSAHGTVTNVVVKEVQRGPGAGQVFGFATFETDAGANAAVAALGLADGAEPTDGQFYVAAAKPDRVRNRPSRSIRLEKPSTQDLCCRNLPFSMTVDELKALFSDYASVDSVRLITRRGVSRGFGFVHFGSEEEAAAAKEKLADKEVGKSANGDALRLRLEFAESAPVPAASDDAAADKEE